MHNPGNLLCSYPNYKEYRDRNQVFSSLLLYSAVSVNLTRHGNPQSLVGQIVSGNYFQTLGIPLAVGGAFTPEEDSVPGAYPVAVIGYGLWMRQFGGDPRVIGRGLELNGRAYTIAGVAPRGFQGLDTLLAGEVWVPMMMYRQIYPYPAWVDQRRALLFAVVGRLKPGVSLLTPCYAPTLASAQGISADAYSQVSNRVLTSKGRPAPGITARVTMGFDPDVPRSRNRGPMRHGPKQALSELRPAGFPKAPHDRRRETTYRSFGPAGQPARSPQRRSQGPVQCPHQRSVSRFAASI